MKARQMVGQLMRREGPWAQDMQRAIHGVAGVSRQRVCLIQVGQDLLGTLQAGFADLGQGEAAGAPIELTRTEVFLQFCDSARHHGGSQVEEPCGTGKTALGDHLGDHLGEDPQCA
ncbi:MAG: hypothetical protein RLZZ618_2685 [Pseudomonadota bacterium]